MVERISLARLKCPVEKCSGVFAVNKEYMGIITCPYCGEYVEG